MRLLRVLPGFVLYVIGACLAFVYLGGHLESLLNPAPLFAVLVLPLAALVGAYGAGGTWRRFRSLLSEEERRRHGFTPGEIGRAVALRIAATYGAAALTTVFEVVRSSRFLIEASSPLSERVAVVGEVIASGLGAFFWAALLCEGLFRPLRHRLDAETGIPEETCAAVVFPRILPALALFGLGAWLIAWFLGLCYGYGSVGETASRLRSLGSPVFLVPVALIPLFPVVAAYGFAGACRRPAAALSLWIASLYGTALFSTVGGLIILAGFLSGDGPVLGEKLRMAVAVLLWAVLLAEGVLRPWQGRLVAGK